MGLIAKIRAILAARRALKDVRALMDTLGKPNPDGTWSPERSYSKASTSAWTAAKINGILSAALIAIRAVWPDLIPWGAERDVEVLAGLNTVGGSAWMLYSVFHADREKHGGTVK